MKGIIVWALGCLIALQSFCSVTWAADFEDRYPLEKVLVLSRHNIRAPLLGPDSVLSAITPHTWYAWTAGTGELSLRGGELETLMGQYFRKWLEQEGLIPENYEPKEGEVRFYANSFQRTIATAQYFSGGMLPIANVRIERHLALNESDPVFIFQRKLPMSNEGFRQRVMAELEAMGGNRGIGESIADEVALVERVLDFKDSELARERGMESFPLEDVSVVVGDSFYMAGSFSPAKTAADALVLQYYEEQDPVKASFGHPLTKEEWTAIGRLKNIGIHTLMHLPTVSARFAHPLLEVMQREMSLEGRKFTFLCGHDINLAAVLSALGVEDYDLPKTIEPETPIGAKLVIEKRKGRDGQEYARLHLVYQNTEQIRNREMLSLEHPPVVFPLYLKGLRRNEDGLYLFSDLEQRFLKAMEDFSLSD